MRSETQIYLLCCFICKPDNSKAQLTSSALTVEENCIEKPQGNYKDILQLPLQAVCTDDMRQAIDMRKNEIQRCFGNSAPPISAKGREIARL